MESVSKKAIVIIVAGLVVLAGSWAAYYLIAPPLITAMYNGESLDFLNQIVATGRDIYPLEYYLGRGEKFFRQIFGFEVIAYVLAVTGVLPIRLPQRLWQKIKAFFNVDAHPVSLAIFRIGFYTLMLFFALDWAGGEFDAANVLWWSEFPRALQFPPPGLGWFLDIVPITPAIASVASKLFVLVCFTALIGLFSRTSAFLSVVIGFYVLGIPQFFGTINHYQHLLWFALVLALSPSGDALSVDALFQAWRQADRGDTTPPGRARRYAVPLRLTWVLIGIVYFFPGYWKLWESGLAWAFSDNLKMQMYKKWFQIGNWTPLVQIDSSPFMYQSAALLTLIFEITFIFFIFSPVLRWFSVIVGQLFHTMTLILMRIPFIDLQVCYVVFFEWDRIFERLGNRLYKNRMQVVYDGSSRRVRRLVAVLRRFDLFGQVDYVARSAADFKGLDAAAKTAVFLAVKQDETWTDLAALRVVAKRIPLLWPLQPFLGVWPLSRGATAVFTDKDGADDVSAPTAARAIFSGPSTRTLSWVGGALVVINIIFGFAHIHSWPFSMYPTFQTIQGPEFESVTMELITVDGDVVSVTNDVILQNFTDDRFFSMISVIFRESARTDNLERRDRRLLAVWEVLANSNEQLAEIEVETVRFYRDKYVVIPERWHENPIEHTLLAEIAIGDTKVGSR